MNSDVDTADEENRVLLVDASVFITLSEIGAADPLWDTAGTIIVPNAMASEITDEPATSVMERARERGSVRVVQAEFEIPDARARLGVDSTRERVSGDVALLALALHRSNAVVVSDDKPLRQACKALSIPVTGSIGLLIRAVERGDLGRDEAKDRLYAMDEVGARLSASLVRRAEQLIDEASEN